MIVILDENDISPTSDNAIPQINDLRGSMVIYYQADVVAFYDSSRNIYRILKDRNGRMGAVVPDRFCECYINGIPERETTDISHLDVQALADPFWNNDPSPTPVEEVIEETPQEEIDDPFLLLELDND